MNCHCRKLLARLRSLYPPEARHLVRVRNVRSRRVSVRAPFDGEREAWPVCYATSRTLALQGAIIRRRGELAAAAYAELEAAVLRGGAQRRREVRDG